MEAQHHSSPSGTTVRALQALRDALGQAHVMTAAEAIAPYAVDWRRKFHGRPLAVLRPGTVDEVCAALRIAADHRLAVVPQGGNTGLSGGATPDASGGQLVLSLKRLNRVRALDTANDTITVEAGCLLEHVQQAALAQQRLFPLAMASQGSCTIGGNLATNAGGTAVLRYGNARELCLGLEVVTPQGDRWDGLRALRKDNTGYDLRDLYIGAEGTLGVITAAVMKLFPLPAAALTALVACDSAAAALAFFDRARRSLGPALTAFELVTDACIDLLAKHYPALPLPFMQRHPYAILLELSDHEDEAHANATLEALLEAALNAHEVVDGVVAASIAQSRGLWQVRERISEAQGLEGAHVKHDIALPISAVPAFLAAADAAVGAAVPGARVAAFGHLGDGNLHYNILAPVGDDPQGFVDAHQRRLNGVVHDLVSAYAGSISAEHGLGQLRRDENARYKDPLELRLMQQIKSAFDPDGRMNPGKVLGADPQRPDLR